MKNFLVSMLGALTALIIFSLGACIMFFGFLGIIAALSSGGGKGPSITRGSFVVFDLSVNITDAPPRIDFGEFANFDDFGGDRVRTMQLRTVTRALRAAATDSRIAGVFIKGSVTPLNFGSGFAALKEVRAALAAVRGADKPVKAYLTSANTRDYYLASVATDLVLDPYGLLELPGLATEPVFFAGAFEKYGVGVQTTRVGKYKSYVEPYTRTEMSPEDREQTQKLLSDIWGTLVGEMAKSRGLTPARLQAVVDAEGILQAAAAKEAKLVDRIAYRDEVIEDLKKLTGRAGSDEPFKQISLADYARLTPDSTATVQKKKDEEDSTVKSAGHGVIGVLYAEGEIVDGDGEPGSIGSAKFARELRTMRQDDEIKAIVLRVNSPGGSATASEEIQREIRLAKKVKPVIVSMGTYAASGGYWISTYGDRIFAEPTTVTGSIGVVSIQFDIKKLAGDFGVTFDSVKTGKFADLGTLTRQKTPEEMAIFQRQADWFYGEFIAKVAESRKLTKEAVEEIAQGRVWSGSEARKLGLVDELGGLDAAIAFAAKKAGLGSNYRLSEYPRRKELAELLSEFFENLRPLGGAHASTGLATRIMQRMRTEMKTLESFNDPLGLYTRLPLGSEIR